MKSIRHISISIKKISFLLFLGIYLFSHPFSQAGLPFSPGDIPDLTEEERAAFELIGSLDEQELGQLMQEIEREFEKLSPEEKQMMLGEIDKEAQRLQGKINNYYSDQGLPPEMPSAPSVQEKPTKTVEQKKQTDQPQASKEKKELLSKKVKSAESLIARILQVIEKYLITGQTIPDFDEQVEQWGKEEQVKNWKRGLNWILFKDDIDELVRKLHKIKDRDPNTKQYKYLEDMVKDESLYNSLNYLNQEMQKYGESLQGVSLETGLLPSQAEKAIQEITGLLAEALYQLNITAGLNKAIEPYQSVASELKTKQEEYEKQALAESKKTRPVRPVYVVGDELEQYGGVTIPTAPAVKRPAYRPPSARKRAKRPVAKKPEKKPELLSGPVGQGAKKAKAAATGKKKSTDKKKAGEKKKEKVKDDKTAEGFLKDIATDLAKATSTLNRELKNIIKNVKSKDPLNESLIQSSIPNITKQLENIANAAEALNVHIKGLSLSKEQKAHYSEQLKNTLKAQIKPLSMASKELKRLRSNFALIPADKMYAYFGGVIKNDEDREKMKKLPKTNIGNLESALNRVMNVAKKK